MKKKILATLAWGFILLLTPACEEKHIFSDAPETIQINAQDTIILPPEGMVKIDEHIENYFGAVYLGKLTAFYGPSELALILKKNAGEIFEILSKPGNHDFAIISDGGSISYENFQEMAAYYERDRKSGGMITLETGERFITLAFVRQPFSGGMVSSYVYSNGRQVMLHYHSGNTQLSGQDYKRITAPAIKWRDEFIAANPN